MTLERTLKIGTRGSELAMWQAHHVEALLNRHQIPTEIVIIETTGDKVLNKAISKIGSKGVFTEELEAQLRTGEIDIAVHSAKDLQSQLADDLHIIAYTVREKVNDVLVSYNKNFNLDRSQKLILGTSSTRRMAMVRKYLPQVRTSDIRGNLQTRLRKLEEGNYDALLLAYAGVHRMGYDALVVRELPTEEFTPAVGQGTVAIEASKHLDGGLVAAIRAAVNDPHTEQCLLAERAYLRRIDGGCSIPVFGLASWNEQESIVLHAGIISLNGKKIIRVEQTALPGDAERLGIAVAEEVLGQGGGQILQDIRSQKA